MNVGSIPESLRWPDRTPVCHSDRLEFPAIRQVTGRNYSVLKVFAVRDRDIVLLIWPGFQYDGFSVPRPLWWFQSPFVGAGTVGSLGHDAWFACHFLEYTLGARSARMLADEMFLNVMLNYQVRQTKARIMYRAVRGASWHAWNRNRQQSEFNRQYVQLYRTNQAELLKTTLNREAATRYLLREVDKTPGNAEFIKREIASIQAGNIDPQITNCHD